MEPKSQQTLANNIRLALARSGMGVNDLASLTGIPCPTLYGIQYQGASRLSIIIAISLVLNLPVDVLYCGNILQYERSAGEKSEEEHALDLEITGLLQRIGEDRCAALFPYTALLLDRKNVIEKPTEEIEQDPQDTLYNDINQVICGYNIPALIKSTKRNIKAMCAMKGIVLATLAQAIDRNVSALYASMDEGKVRSNFNINLLQDIANFFGVSMEFCIFGGSRTIVHSRRELNKAMDDVQRYEYPSQKIARLLPFLSIDQKKLIVRMISELTF